MAEQQNGEVPPEKQGLSLSFGGFKGKAKPSVRSKEADGEEAAKRVAITGFGVAGALTADGKPAPAAKCVIPRQEDSFKVGVGKKAKPARFLPDHDDGSVGNVEDKFEAEAKTAPEQVTYGLSLQPKRVRTGDGAASADHKLAAGGLANGGSGQQNGRAAQNGSGGGAVNGRDWETRAFKDDVSALPDAADAAAYDAMPVEEFGAAMLRGMGWTEGGSVGRRLQGPTQPVQYVQRPPRLGLGAQPAAPEVGCSRKRKQMYEGAVAHLWIICKCSHGALKCKRTCCCSLH